MKFTAGIIVGFLLGLVIFTAGTAGLAYLVVMPAFSVSSSSSDSSSAAVPQTGSVYTGPAPTITMDSSNIPTDGFSISEGDISLAIDILSVEGSGFSRTVNGQITNDGRVDLHNCLLKVELYSNGDKLKINGQDSLTRSYGTLDAGDTITDSLEIKLSLTDGFKATQNGVLIVLTFSSDEKEQVMPFEYNF
jgi:hypothetical protein